MSKHKCIKAIVNVVLDQAVEPVNWLVDLLFKLEYSGTYIHFMVHTLMTR